MVDLSRVHTIEDAALQSHSRISPWNGRRVQGLPLHTLVRGRFVMKDRVLVPATRGWGRSVHTIQAMPPPAVRHADTTLHAIAPERTASRKGDAA